MKKISARQYCCILFASGIGPALIVGSRFGWTGALVGGIAACLAWWYLLRDRDARSVAERIAGLHGGKMLLWGYLLWCGFLLGWLIQQTEAAFPEMTVFPILPGILLLLALWCSMGSCERLGRCSAILSVVLAVMFGAVLCAGCFEAEWKLQAVKREDVWQSAALLLFPSVSLLYIDDTKGKVSAVWSVVLAGSLVICAGVVAGIMGGMTSQNGLYSASKSISLGGVMERFEALVSAALSAAIFVSMTSVFKGMDKISKNVLKTPEWLPKRILAVLASVVWWMPNMITEGVGLLGILLFGVLSPILARLPKKPGRNLSKGLDK